MRFVAVVVAGAALALAAAVGARAEPGLVYRTGWGGGEYFHPLGSFANLNRAVAAGNRRQARKLADALVARAEPRRFALVWRYRTPRDGPSTWTSGLAQAVGAQALARAGRIEEARRAFLAIPNGLLVNLPEGPWIKLYSYSGSAVLNAQLQATLSIADYARLAHDPRARRLARRMRLATLALLGRFDTGTWSRYALGGADSTSEYHAYVTSLLWKFARRTGGWRWRVYAARFRGYRFAPPRMRFGGRVESFYPDPADGFRDRAELRIWLSKPALVTLRVAGQSWRTWLGRGWQRTDLTPRPLPPGRHRVVASATDRFGHTTWKRLQYVRVLRDVTAPRIVAELAPWQLYWRAHDGESPWVALRVRIVDALGVRTVKLGGERFAGSLPLALPLDPSRSVTLVATDSSGNQSWLPLEVGGPPRLGSPSRTSPRAARTGARTASRRRGG